MKISFVWIVGLLLSYASFSQGGGQQVPPQNQLPDFFSPAPEASAIIKADLLNIGYTTGSPNVNIPLFNLQTGSYSLPVNLNYSSTGIKVDEYASMVGMGWTLNYGGVISRTVMDQPDENRDPSNCNLNSLDFFNPDEEVFNFLRSALDKQSDIFSFSFPGYSGKFILNLSLQPVQLTKQNLKIESINNNFFQNGFRIITDDGTEYIFQDVEVTQGMNPTGQNCQKTYENSSSIKTSWYLTKIILPSKQKWIDFTYITVNNVKYQSSITQTISRSTYTQQYLCTPNQCPTCCSGQHGDACPVGSETFSTCISQQKVNAKLISKIENNDGDKIEFFYDASSRQDLENGKRLSSFKVTSRNGTVLRNVVFTGSYQNTIIPTYPGLGDGYTKFRLFLESVAIRNGSNSSTNQLLYSFNYDSYGTLPPRLSYAQDFYGYYNGKLNNQSLIPKLQSNDINYQVFHVGGNGNGSSSVAFGDRSIDINSSKKGLLTKVTYPTGGYDIIAYSPNYVIKMVNGNETEVLAGGSSVSKITSYTSIGQKILEREFIYRNYSDNKLSSFLLTKNLIFSQQITTYKDGYFCQPGENITCLNYDIGPACAFAIVTSNANNPIASYGGQHIYFRSVQEIIKGNGTADNGMTEHKYSYFNGGQLAPRHWLGNRILNAPFQIVPDILIGETNTDIYKNIAQSGNPPDYKLVRTILRNFVTPELNHYSNYIVKQNYDPLNQSDYPNPSMMASFDVEETYINTYTYRLNYTLETEYDDNGLPTLTNTTYMEYENMSYTYPRRIRTTESDGIESKIERKYPPDIPTSPYTGTNSMTSRNIISPVIEETQYKNNVLQTTRTQSYTDVFSNTNLYAPQVVDLKIGNNTLTQKIKFHLYDIYGNTKEISKNDDNNYLDQHIVYIWDYKDNYPIAKVQNALNNNNIAYTSFEADGKGNWTYSGSTVTPTEQWAPTGKKYYDLGTGNVSKSGLNASLTYYVSYWSKTGSKAVSNTVSITTGRSINGWVYFEHKVSNPSGGTVTVSGSGAIDELRLYPEGALMTTMTYEPLVGITSQCDPNNRITYYVYDDFSRLSLIVDQDFNTVKKICYNYHNQPEDCTSPCYNRFPDWQNIGNPTCIQDGCGNTGYQNQQQQDMNPCSPTYGQTQYIQIYNPAACPPANGVYITYNVVPFASGFTAVYTNNSTQQQYTFPIPTGSGTLGCIPEGIYSLSISNPGNSIGFYFGNGCQFMTGTSAYWGKVNVSATGCNTVTIEFEQQ